jgi:CRISPR-associated protein Cas1
MIRGNTKTQAVLAAVTHLQGPGILRARGGHLVFHPAGGPPVPIRADHLESLVCDGSVEVTSQALRELARRGVDVAWQTGCGGREAYRLESPDSSNAMLRVRQVRAFDNPVWQVPWARLLVGLKVDALASAARHGQRHGAPGAGEVLEQLVEVLGRLPMAETLDQIRGHEGAASAHWYRYFATRVPTPFTFTGRVRRPPTDPVNALLSLASTFLLGRVEGLIRARGLEPALGVLHAFRHGRPSLACDLMEPYRPDLVDRWVLRSLRSGLVAPGDFSTTTEKGTRLTGNAFKRVVAAWEQEFTEGDFAGHVHNLMEMMSGSWDMRGPLFGEEQAVQGGVGKTIT